MCDMLHIDIASGRRRMAWAKVDDKLFSHPKFLAISLAARGLWITALSYAARLERDGWFPGCAVTLFAPKNAHTDAYVRELLAAGLWVVAERQGYRLHDFLEYNPSSKELKRQRKQTAKRVQRHRNRTSVRNGVTHALVTVPPSRPVPSRPQKILSSTSYSHLKSAGFEAFWSLYPRHVGKQAALRAWRKLTPPLD